MRARVILSTLVAIVGLGISRESRAEVPDSRFGLVPALGGGVAVLTGTGGLPNFIGYTTLGAELFGQLERWGLYGRFDFLSSGNAGRWTAYEGSLGASYRIFGGSDSLALFARAGVVYQHWVGEEEGGCSILFFVPNSCVTEGNQTESTNADALGLSGGVRLEMPLRSIYVAIGATFVPVVVIDDWPSDIPNSANTGLHPTSAFQLRLDLDIGLRDNRSEHKAVHDRNEHRTSL